MTGAGGFIGRALCARLCESGAAVAGLEVDPGAAERIAGSGASFVHCDTTDRAALRRALEGVELLVHTAARVSDWGPMDDFIRVNVGGTRNVLDAAREAGCEQIVHVSSVATWGYEHRSDLDEDAPPRPCGIIACGLLACSFVTQ